MDEGARMRFGAQERYYPLLAYAGWTLIASGLWIVARAPLGAEAAALAQDGHGLGPFLQRLLGSAYQEGMAVLLLGALFYSAMQFLALWRDARTLSREAPTSRWGDTVLAWSAGRSRAFWRDGRDPMIWRTRHFRFGADVSMRPINVLIWVFPMLGFLGTVVGLSGAVADLGRLTAVSDGIRPDALSPVFANLDVAFDTTIQGIVAALALTALATMLDLRWTELKRLDIVTPPSQDNWPDDARSDVAGLDPKAPPAAAPASAERTIRRGGPRNQQTHGQPPPRDVV